LADITDVCFAFDRQISCGHGRLGCRISGLLTRARCRDEADRRYQKQNSMIHESFLLR